jgi:hypothetical protein
MRECYSRENARVNAKLNASVTKVVEQFQRDAKKFSGQLYAEIIGIGSV